MKRDVKSLLSISLAAMPLPLPIVNVPLALPFDIWGGESTSAILDVLDDSIPIVEGVPTKYFRWLEDLS